MSTGIRKSKWSIEKQTEIHVIPVILKVDCPLREAYLKYDVL